MGRLKRPRHTPEKRRELFAFIRKHHASQCVRCPERSRLGHLLAVANHASRMMWIEYGNNYGFCLTPANELAMNQVYSVGLLHEAILGSAANFDDIAHLTDYRTAVMVAEITPDCRLQQDRRCDHFAGQLSEASIIAQAVALADICLDLQDALLTFEEWQGPAARDYWEERLAALEKHHQALRRLKNYEPTETSWAWAKTTLQELFESCSKEKKLAGIRTNIAKRKKAEAEELKAAAERFQHGT